MLLLAFGLVLDAAPSGCQIRGTVEREEPRAVERADTSGSRSLLDLPSAVDPALQAEPFSTDWSILPFVIYNPETSLAFGALYARVTRATEDGDSTESIRSSLTVNAQYTLKNQVVGGFSLETRPDDGSLLLSDASLKLSWPDRLYPPGNRAGRGSYEEWTARSFQARLRFLRRTSDPRLLVGPMAEIRVTEILETEEGGLLEQGSVEGGEDHGLVGLGLAATWDSRSSPVYPTSGSFHSFTLLGARSLLGESRWVLTGEVDLRTYRRIVRGTVLALRGRMRSSWGDVPFTMHAVIGGVAGGLRGIYENRYAHASAAVVMAELRRRLWGRLGAVAFAGVGQVAPNPWSFGVDGFHGAGGGGLRFALLAESSLNVGVDFAVGEGESNLYFILGEVF